MPIRIITLSRELGAGARAVGELVASRLGWRLVDKEVLHAVSRITGAEEVALDALDEQWPLRGAPVEGRIYLSALVAGVKDVADEGGIVLVGRGGVSALHGREDALHVRLVAPRAERIRRVGERFSVSAEAAARMVDESDRSRAAFHEHFFRTNWADPLLYHLVLNTGWVSADEAAQMIVDATSQGEECGR